MEEIINKLKEEARASWSGKTGEERAASLEKYLRKKLKNYSEKLDVPEVEILKSWEKTRQESATNYYQDCNQPDLNGERSRVFETVKDLNDSVKEKKFRCPACNGISSNPYKCNSGKEMAKGKICDWKVYGFFGDLGKGTFVYCKDKLYGETIFTPVCWEED